MKSIYKVILGMWISILSHSVFALDAPTALVPAGLNPGDEFYVMFVSASDTKKRGNLTVIQYNDWVNTEADAASIGPAGGVTWSALMNHEDAAGATTEQTLSLFADDIAAPIYTTAGELIATNRAELFDTPGTPLKTSIRYEADGVTTVTVADTVWTGSDYVGVANSPLGNAAATNATEGLAGQSYLDDRWIDEASPESKDLTPNRIYAVSPLLVVPAAAPAAPAASGGGGGGAMGWSLLMLFSVLSLLRAKVRK